MVMSPLAFLYSARAPSPDLGEPRVGITDSWVVKWGGMDRMAAVYWISGDLFDSGSW